MLALPAPSARLEGVRPQFCPRKPLRAQTLTSKKGQTSAAPTSTCCFRSRQQLAQTVCQLSSTGDAESKHEQHLKSNLGKAALFSFAFAPLAVALPTCYGHGGHDGGGLGGGGGNGDGGGSGGSGHGDNNGTNVIADIAEEDDDDDDEEEEDDEDDDGDQEVSVLPCLGLGNPTMLKQSCIHCSHAFIAHVSACAL